MTERRRGARQKSFLQGRIFFNNGRNSADCLIRDFCENGARLKFSGTIATPEVLELHIPAKGESYRVRVRWRVGDEIGVSFETADASPPPAPGTSADWTARVQKLEHEIAVLQRKFNELQSAIRQIQGAD